MPAPHKAATASNRYRILGRIASGGMADIYIAHSTTDAGVGRHVVLKRVLAEHARDEESARMFLDEARLSAQLQHPNIAQVYDVGQLEGTYFYTMEYVHGEDLRHVHMLLRKRAQLPINLALYIASGALAALHHAHERTAADGRPLEIVHRDVSPSNIMLGFEGAVKLLDFGVAKAAQRSTESVSGSLKGKVAYLSPEQIKGKGVDRRSDVFALGIVLHEMLTGRRLYKRESDYVTLMAIMTDEVPPPSEHRPEVSPDLDRIVLTALQKDHELRYPSAAAMLEDIEALATAERHMVSSSALARFMREQIGTRPEPWFELPTRDDSEPLTITASNSELRSTQGSSFRQQLDQAIDLRPIGRAPTDTPVSRDGVASPVGSDSQPALEAEPPQVDAPRSRRWLVIGAATAILVGAGTGVFVTHNHHAGEAPHAPPPPAPVVPIQPKTAPVTPPPAAAPPTIDELAARNEWNGVLQACRATPQPTADETTTCALAGCNTKQRAVALYYFNASARADRGAIERACAEHGLALVTAKPGPRPAKDPCKDPAYLDANPLKCM